MTSITGNEPAVHVEHAEQALRAFLDIADREGSNRHMYPEDVSDLIADLRFLADARGWPWGMLLAAGNVTYFDESEAVA